MLKRRERFAEAETLIRRLAEQPETPFLKRWYAEQLNNVYLAAFEADGETSLGRGVDLYRNFVARVLAELNAAPLKERHDSFQQLMGFIERAHKRPALVELAADDLRRFVRETLPGLLAELPSQFGDYISTTANRVHDQLGPREGLEFLLGWMEQYPPWLEMSQNNAWNQHGYRLGQWRAEVGDNLGDLEPRLLELVLTELRRDLRSRDDRNRQIYNNQYGYFWEAKRAEFVRTARQSLAERRHSGRSVKYIAEYLFHGLDQFNDGIEALAAADRDGILDDGGQRQLVNFLHERGRYGESIALLETLVERTPTDASLRSQLMVAYHATQRLEQLRTLLRESDEYFRAEGRWNEGVIATLADACQRTELNDQAIAYYNELISLVQRQQGGGESLSTVLPAAGRRLFGAGANRKGRRRRGRRRRGVGAGAAISARRRFERFDRVLSDAKDLEAFAASLDRKAEEIGRRQPADSQDGGRGAREPGQAGRGGAAPAGGGRAGTHGPLGPRGAHRVPRRTAEEGRRGGRGAVGVDRRRSPQSGSAQRTGRPACRENEAEAERGGDAARRGFAAGGGESRGARRAAGAG